MHYQVLTRMRLFGAVSGFWQVPVRLYSNTNHQHGRIVPVRFCSFFSLSPSLCLYHPLRDCPYLHSLLDSGGPTGLHIFWELRLMFMFTFQTLLAALNRTQQNTYNSGTQEFMTHDKKSTVVHHDCPYLNK